MRRPALLLTLTLAACGAPAPRARSTPNATASPSGAPTRCAGRWMGHGQQGDAGTPWSIELEVTAEQGPRCGTIEYPTLRCGGHLAHCWRDADRISAVEEYTHDEGRCAPPGRLDLRCEENAMRWTWHGDDEVTTLLRRVR